MIVIRVYDYTKLHDIHATHKAQRNASYITNHMYKNDYRYIHISVICKTYMKACALQAISIKNVPYKR